MKQRLFSFFAKPYRFAVVYGVLLTAFFAYSLLDAFVIPKAFAAVTAPVQ